MPTTKVNVGNNKKNCDLHLCPSQNLYSGIDYFTSEFGNADSLEEDLFNLASGIYATDLAVHRQDREHYIRTIDLNVEVVNLHAFERIKDLLESALLVVSRDNWTINFVQKRGVAVTEFKWQNKEGAVLLFSGGIDSMCAAAQFVSEKKDLVLVSHNSHANTVIDNCQRNVHSALEMNFKQKIKHIHIKVYARKHGSFKFPEDRENTQRTRSFLFLTLAALVTRRNGFNKVLYIAENGQFAIHLPLNQARVGPFSTHTADPQFVGYAQDIFRTLLSNPDFEIQNPFLYKTKAEVLAVLPSTLQKEVRHSASCWKISHVPGYQHCGFCIPCISRRIAIEYNGFSLSEYHTDIFDTDLDTLSEDDDKKRNIIDYLEFVSKFKKVTKANKIDLLNEFTELYNPAFDTELALKLFERVSAQSFAVFKKYPKILKIIG